MDIRDSHGSGAVFRLLDYRGTIRRFFKSNLIGSLCSIIWWSFGELNPGPQHCKCCALPTELKPQMRELHTSSYMQVRLHLVMYSQSFQHQVLGWDHVLIWRSERGLNPWPPTWQAGILTNWTTTPKFGEEPGIRTPGPFRVDGFQGRCHKPLDQLSIFLYIWWRTKESRPSRYLILTWRNTSHVIAISLFFKILYIGREYGIWTHVPITRYLP